MAATEGHEWIVSTTDGGDDERVPSSLGGVNVGALNVADGLDFIVISDADANAVWMARADRILKVRRCVDT